MAYHPDNGSVYSGGKDGTLIRWSVEGNLSKMRRIKTIQGGRKEIEKYTGHKKSILAVAVNTAGTLVASADESGKIIVWNQDLGTRFNKNIATHRTTQEIIGIFESYMLVYC